MAFSSAIGLKPIVVSKSSSYVNLMLPVRDNRAIVKAKMLTMATIPAVTSPIFFFVSAFIISPIRRAFRKYHRIILTIASVNSTDMHVCSKIIYTHSSYKDYHLQAYFRGCFLFISSREWVLYVFWAGRGEKYFLSHSLSTKHDANFRCAELNTIPLPHRCNLPMFFSWQHRRCF